MNSHAFSISQLRLLRFLAVAFLFQLCILSSACAASDTDVTIIKADKVVIEDSVITIMGQARTTVRLISDALPVAGKGSTWMGRPVTVVEALSDKATFIIKRPELRSNGPDGSHAEAMEKNRKILDDGWAMSLAAAKELQAGREVGRIGFYAPDIAIKSNLIDSIAGFGFLYPKGK